MLKIGIIKEGKQPIDKRVPLNPSQAKKLEIEFGVKVYVQKSEIRCYSDEEYEEEGLELVDEVQHCEVLLGVKEVPISHLIDGKTYFFFSHTIKKQEYNKPLLENILSKKITLIDYETLTNKRGERLIAFGRWAGIVGAYNGIKTYGERYNLFHLKPAHECFDLEDLKDQLYEVSLPNIKIVVTGGGRVAKGAMEILHHLEIRKVNVDKFLSEYFDEPVFAQLNNRDYSVRKKGGLFNRTEFFNNPSLYESDFLKFTEEAELLIAAAYWKPNSPVLFERGDVFSPNFHLKVIADITCDIEGSIPSTLQASTIENPVYDYNPSEHRIENPYTDEANLTVMAVDNLPCELPRDASADFGNQMLENIIPALLNDEEGIISRATITKKGEITSNYDYLKDWINE